MVAIKDMAEMPKGCWYSTDLKLSGITTCPLKDYCSRKHIKEAPLDKRPKDCPLVEIEERKVGKWIYDKASQNWRCSVCNETPKTLGYVGTADFMEKEFAFCNHCGAEMRGAENVFYI